MAELIRRQQGSTSISVIPKFAYASVISGCTNISCAGYITNSLVAKQVLTTHNSTADVVLLVRMSTKAGFDRLAPDLETWIHKAGIRLAYLPKLAIDNFGTAVLEKFRILEMTEYDRVLFIDGDAHPICNADYIFRESYQPDGRLQDYVAFAQTAAPTTAAYFLATPREGLFDQFLDVVRNRPNMTHFDPIQGWGHAFDMNDEWHSLWWTRRIWDFKASASDQGLLLYFFKYKLLNYSQILDSKNTDLPTRDAFTAIQTWQEVPNPSPDELANINTNDSTVFRAPNGKYITIANETSMQPEEGCPTNKLGRYFYEDIYHHAGGEKPWLPNLTAVDTLPFIKEGQRDPRDRQVWLYYLTLANLNFGLRLPPQVPKVPKGADGGPLGVADRNTNMGQSIWGGDLFKAGIELPKPGGWTWEPVPEALEQR